MRSSIRKDHGVLYQQPENMARARDLRKELQQLLIHTYPKTLISFCLNIPGPIKSSAVYQQLHDRGAVLLKEHLLKEGIQILHELYRYAASGPEAFLSVEAEPKRLKKLTVDIEETAPLGRLWDIDVLDPESGRGISREEIGFPARSCFLCDAPAAVCARSRAHSLEELQSFINALLNSELS